MTNKKSFKNLLGGAALAALCIALAPSAPEARTYGAVTSNLTTAKFSLMKGWWGTDHDLTTAPNFKYFKALATTYGISMDTFNLTSSTAPLTAVNLAKYDVMVWYNVYRMYEHMDTATGNRVQRWYEGNKGLACIHQCVRSSTTSAGIPWTWWISAMGKDYIDYAASGVTGPVFVDSEAISTIYGPGEVTAGQKFTWSDEWYIYVGNPRGLPGTKMMWTTADSNFVAPYKKTMGNDHPLVWVRNFDGGRFVLNGMYHTTALSTSTGALRAFADSSFIGQLRFLAGYTGCMDSAYVEYNPMATHQGTNACLNPAVALVASAGSADRVKLDDFKISFSQPGNHSVEIFNTLGTKVASHRGNGTQEYRFAEIRQPGIYYVRILTEGMKAPVSRKVVLL
jgi:hypothetical protein